MITVGVMVTVTQVQKGGGEGKMPQHNLQRIPTTYCLEWREKVVQKCIIAAVHSAASHMC